MTCDIIASAKKFVLPQLCLSLLIGSLESFRIISRNFGAVLRLSNCWSDFVLRYF